jgi:hypothetical protein
MFEWGYIHQKNQSGWVTSGSGEDFDEVARRMSLCVNTVCIGCGEALSHQFTTCACAIYAACGGPLSMRAHDIAAVKSCIEICKDDPTISPSTPGTTSFIDAVQEMLEVDAEAGGVDDTPVAAPTLPAALPNKKVAKQGQYTLECSVGGSMILYAKEEKPQER